VRNHWAKWGNRSRWLTKRRLHYRQHGFPRSGAAILPRLAAIPIPEGVQVKALPVPLERLIGAAVLSNVLHSPAVFTFLDLLRGQECSPLPNHHKFCSRHRNLSYIEMRTHNEYSFVFKFTILPFELVKELNSCRPIEKDKVPSVTFRTRQNNEWVDVTTDDLFAGKKVVVFLCQVLLRQRVHQPISLATTSWLEF
jgi:hypothetical protein